MNPLTNDENPRSWALEYIRLYLAGSGAGGRFDIDWLLRNAEILTKYLQTGEIPPAKTE